ncbi:DUF4186 family protein [Polyangium jinanense]|uniref:DUF4186 family protein n=1 Tax=Polyangium jinanense TaxID=2829994 RepID=A0A9X3X924_9BACT|nr:DUF4186 family protein [Polyangium jinanense]MDC3985967.1 DUF4186 family protein [Polyangium jinanense]
MTAPEDDDDLQPLGVTCTSTDCENGLHCFLQKERKRSGFPRRGGPCRDCNVDLIAWDRVNARDLQDAAYTFEALRNELIRHVFWHSTFNEGELNHATRKGRLGMRDAARKRVESSVGRPQHPREGRQTPFSGNVLYHAQHAVAACCRKCIEYWHAIPADRELEPAEIDYFVELIMLYIGERLPTLADEPKKVPPRRRAVTVSAS